MKDFGHGFSRLTRSPVFWPLLGLGALGLLNALFNPAFLKVTLLDGHLYGTPVDIFLQGSRTMLVALGMTLVIATGGIDLSVGSVVAVAGAICATMLQGGQPMPLVLLTALGTGMLAGFFNGWLVAKVRIQPIVATVDSDGGRTRGGSAHRGRTSSHHQKRPFRISRQWLRPRSPARAARGGRGVLADPCGTAANCPRTFYRGNGRQRHRGTFRGTCGRLDQDFCLCFCGGCAALAGVLTAANIRAADAYRAGENMELDAIFAVVVGGTALSGGRFLVFGTWVGALLIQTLTTSMYNLGVPPAVAPMPKALLIVAAALLQSERVVHWLQRMMPVQR